MSSLPVTRTEVSNSGSGDQKLSFDAKHMTGDSLEMIIHLVMSK